ncbi:UDP-N-acetylmuramoyl-L-alanyl-D-glutamate--2,6-diaminopimelate ligase [Methylomonas sp. LL1]|uniref:UDP-N-acetylmuramoyl-L-alanyl-D-glutamate--2, 6-diaminopimelate ligase n=1 Tax=Methylomonas sp. LL1 TaxID=2785785 RepID=UPI0018C40134|nr:UDP-N-acetylmuramoyl-L-alanyl-D-glutamate--2,6-diaminopimelate ligase [Methylomonas sp. LL1]QPK62510.1 UDP-N-acetylmuramoyl-L-alanyl-D-glutamate--2,6-diaminopimelate ligase [Methylomonas sp. LL1]
MKLSQLLLGIAEINTDLEISGLCLDSRSVKAGELFIALNGALRHGLNHAEQAIDNGAVAVIYDPEGIADPQPKTTGVPAVAIIDLSRHLGQIAARFYSHPSKRLDVIGITGTNGKTTCSQLIAQAAADCGVIGTLGWGEPGQLQTTANTTPDALAVQHMLHTLDKQGKRIVAMEVSSHGLQQGRVNAVDFKGAVFTNLSRDHLDYHGTMREYLRAKLGLFTNPALQFAVINLDDPNSEEVLSALDENVNCWGFSTSGRRADDVECVVADNVQHNSGGICFDVHWSGQTLRASTSVVGAFNLLNVLTVLCVLLAMGWPFDQAVAQLARLKAVTGRMETFGGQGKPSVVVDYAHTPDALEKVLLAARGTGKLWTVFGCGGDRDKGKRPQMGRIAETYADHVIVTDDNPRSEASADIINDILAGCQSNKVSIINDRNTAITTVIQQAGQDDRVVIAGKGHENYQEIKGVKIPFSDQAVVQQALAAWRPKP